MRVSWLFSAFSGLLVTPAVASQEEISLLAFQKRADLAEFSESFPMPYGVILWSEGTSGTTSFFKTLSGLTHASLCNDDKESFETEVLTASALQACGKNESKKHGKPSMMHIKPFHLAQKNNELRTPEEFFKAAKDAGYGFVVGNFRENQLARDLAKYDKGWKDQTGKPQDYLDERREYNNALLAARNMGLVVIPMSFADTVTDTCQAARLVLSTVASHIGVTGKGPLWKQLEHEKCVAVERQTIPHDHADLVERTSDSEAQEITSFLENTEFAWMLNTTAYRWPDTAVPSIPVVTSQAQSVMRVVQHKNIDKLAAERLQRSEAAIDAWEKLQHTNDEN